MVSAVLAISASLYMYICIYVHASYVYEINSHFNSLKTLLPSIYNTRNNHSMSNQALSEKLDQTTEILSTKLGELVKLASLDDDENDPSLSAVSTNGLLMVNSQTMQLVKGVQDLLVLTRSIREKWLLNQIPEQGATSAPEFVQEPEELEQLLDRCMQEVIGE